ncbi:p-hydroxybenzoate octaprenyltransferase [Candidatus Methylopumilus planktonicus]|uniref:4-hydroxybenzoate octaprenyltransferase n=1 Tax=Candidatus Methylopumilus planktonicus TaxID=1581557 RepID=A0A0D6EU42_9PROT|nr:4-hydroxybenzoate octaprenyltransferase [Candidatus Methylopumilus planktonicus]CEZ18948.1 p-hydroxybenzoate octaprenyltransferase [Candidatus Methylopumilus planktonicus]
MFAIKQFIRLMRLDKPIGIFLLLWPTLWALFIASHGLPTMQHLTIFILGTVLMRSAGCVANDMLDRKFDSFVTRTKLRPLANQSISVKNAFFLLITLLLGAFICVLFLNENAFYFSLVALFLALTYPLTKRFFVMPQAYLGLSFGMGIPMAFVANNISLSMTTWLLFLANIFWVIAYDTLYAVTDKNDDLKIGIRSSAIWFGAYVKEAIMICYTCMMGCLIWVGQLENFGWPFYGFIGLSLIFIGFLYRQIRTLNPKACFAAFLSNNYLGGLVFLGVFFHYLHVN